MKANVELRIDELVLRGLPYAQRGLIAAAIEAEVQRLLDEGGLPPSLAEGGVLPELQVSGLQVAQDARPGEVGQEIAGAIYRNLSGVSSVLGERSKA